MGKRNYAQRIKEDINTLKKIELQVKYAFQKKVIQLLKLLKSGKCNLREAAQLMSISYKSACRYWNFYETNGIEGIKKWKDTRCQMKV